MLDEITFFFFGRAFARGHPDHAFAAATLRSERAHRRPFDEATVRDADNTALIRDQVLHVDIALVRDELGQARRAMLVPQLAQFFLDDGEDALLFGENVAQILDRLD